MMGTHSLSIPQPPPSPGEQTGVLVPWQDRPVQRRPTPQRPPARKGAMPPGLQAWGKPQRLLPLVVLVAGGLIAYGTVGAPAPMHVPPGKVKQWITQADRALEAAGTPASKLNDADTYLIIMGESGGNPNALNGSDSNAAAGHPSKGLMQTIDSTFEAHRLPSLPDNVYDPVANIAAGVRYALGRYGSLDNVPGVASVHDGGRYVGY